MERNSVCKSILSISGTPLSVKDQSSRGLGWGVGGQASLPCTQMATHPPGCPWAQG